MTCKELPEQRLQEYIDGTLPLDDAATVEHHLTLCTVCAIEERDIRALLAEIASLHADPSTLDCSDEPATAPERLLFELSDAIANRQMALASSIVNANLLYIVELDPLAPDSAQIFSSFVQWMDLGFAQIGQETQMSNLDLAREIRMRFSPGIKRELSVTDYAHVRLAEGLIAIHEERFAEALAHFNYVVSVEADLSDGDVIASAWGGAARALSRQGRYADAEYPVEQALALARTSGRRQMEGTFLLTKAWIRFQFGDYKVARTLLEAAERTLTDCDLALGNIESARGRIAARTCDPVAALEHFCKAMEHYRRCHRDHLNCGRALINSANVERLIARRCDRMARHLCVCGHSPTTTEKSIEARLHLAQAYRFVRAAKRIYKHHSDYRGCGTVEITLSTLAMDLGRIDVAVAAAATAYEIGASNGDVILKARARIQQTRVANLRTTRTSRSTREAFNTADLARSLSNEAVELAEQTQNPRLIMKARVVQGVALVQCGAPRRTVRACWLKVKQKHEPHSEDPIREEYDVLRSACRRPSTNHTVHKDAAPANQIENRELLVESD